jgi:large subunit ribosomal protein L2
LNYADGEKRYILCPQGLTVGMKVMSGDNVAPELGNSLPMKNMPLGTIIHNIELQPGQGGVMARSQVPVCSAECQRREICRTENAFW